MLAQYGVLYLWIHTVTTVLQRNTAALCASHPTHQDLIHWRTAIMGFKLGYWQKERGNDMATRNPATWFFSCTCWHGKGHCNGLAAWLVGQINIQSWWTVVLKMYNSKPWNQMDTISVGHFCSFNFVWWCSPALMWNLKYRMMATGVRMLLCVRRKWEDPVTHRDYPQLLISQSTNRMGEGTVNQQAHTVGRVAASITIKEHKKWPRLE
jgi:uncharacterized protein (DUF2237 family)